MEHVDAVVIGAGPAGLAAAIAAARAGFSVLVADLRRPPIEKLCGEGLLPDALVALQQLGVDLNAQSGAVFSGISFHENGVSFAAAFPGPTALGVKRTVLHEALNHAAVQYGVTFAWGERAERLGPGRVQVGDAIVDCRFIIGADGQHSLVRKSAGLTSRAARPDALRKKQRLASGVHYRCAPWSRHVEVHWTSNVQVYVTPVSADEISVAVICLEKQVRADECLQLFPCLQARLHNKEKVGRELGATSLMLNLPRVVRAEENGATLLIGEASGAVDAITGEGLSLIFHQAVALEAALRANDLRQYEQAHRRIMRRPRWMAHLLLSLSEYPGWRLRAFRALAADPGAFANLLSLHIGERPRIFGRGGAAGFCTHLLFDQLLVLD